MRRDPVKTIPGPSRSFGTHRHSRKNPRLGTPHRRLGFEPLEDRRLLSLAPENPAASGAIELFNVSPALFVENQGQWPDPTVRYAF